VNDDVLILSRLNILLGMFTKLERATVSFVLCVCPSVHPSVQRHRTAQLPLDGFSLNLMNLGFFKILQENSSLIKI